MCPLLVETEHGWCCSVRDRDVRPFWGRPLAAVAGAGVAIYLVAVLAVFGFLRGYVGVAVNVAQVAWPGKWHEISRAQADLLYRRAMAAFQAGRLNEAFLALTSAQARDRSHYPSGVLLAQITMFQGSFYFSDDLFRRLLQTVPEKRFETSLVYYDTLLALNRLDRLGEFALESGLEDGSHAALWNNALLFALRSGRIAKKFFDQHDALIGRLPPHARMLVEAEREVVQGRGEVARRQLQAPFRGPLNPVYMRSQVERLSSLGDEAGAQALLDFYGPILGDFEHSLVQLALDIRGRNRAAASANWQRLCAMAGSPQRIERLAEALVRNPDAERFRVVHERVVADARLQDGGSTAALWVAGLVCGRPAEAGFWSDLAGARLDERFPDLKRIDFASRRIAEPSCVLNIVNSATLPREMVVALLTRMQGNALP